MYLKLLIIELLKLETFVKVMIGFVNSLNYKT